MLVSIKGNVPELHPKAVVSIASLVLVSQNCKLLHSTGAVFFFFFSFCAVARMPGAHVGGRGSLWLTCQLPWQPGNLRTPEASPFRLRREENWSKAEINRKKSVNGETTEVLFLQLAVSFGSEANPSCFLPHPPAQPQPQAMDHLVRPPA